MAKNELEKKALKDKDFPLAFPNLEAIEVSELTPDEQLREKVKHLSMQMFGIAVDLANQQRKYNNAGLRIDELKKEILHLRSLLAKRNAYIKDYCKGIKALQSRVKELEAGGTPTEKKTRALLIKDLTTEERQAIQADYYEKRIAALSTQVRYWKDKAQDLQARLKAYEDSPK